MGHKRETPAKPKGRLHLGVLTRKTTCSGFSVDGPCFDQKETFTMFSQTGFWHIARSTGQPMGFPDSGAALCWGSPTAQEPSLSPPEASYRLVRKNPSVFRCWQKMTMGCVWKPLPLGCSNPSAKPADFSRRVFAAHLRNCLTRSASMVFQASSRALP